MNGRQGPQHAVAQVTAADGTIVPLDFFATAQARWAVLFLPALGIQSRLYQRLATGLAAGGCAVLLMEQRGHGRSPVRASRRNRFGMADFLEQDIPAALGWLDAQIPAKVPRVIGGHSLGANLATLFAGMHPRRVDGVFHVATGSPYHRDFPPQRARLIRFLARVLPLFEVFPGYFPGKLVGFAGRESLGLMRDWADWALTGRLDFGGRTGLEEAVAGFRGAFLAVAVDADHFSSPAAADRAAAPFVHARVRRQHLGAAEQGEFLGHFAWARNPSGVVQSVLEWLAEEVPARSVTA